jgi:hypothetical protein
MLAAFGGVNHLDTVPVVGRGDDDRVDVFSLQDITIIMIRLNAGPGGL